MIRKAAKGEGPPDPPVYAETLDGDRFEIYQDSIRRLRLHVNGKLERVYQGPAAYFAAILRDLRDEWEVEPSEEEWPRE